MEFIQQFLFGRNKLFRWLPSKMLFFEFFCDFLHNCAVMLEQNGVLLVLRRPDANTIKKARTFLLKFIGCNMRA